MSFRLDVFLRNVEFSWKIISEMSKEETFSDMFDSFQQIPAMYYATESRDGEKENKKRRVEVL